MAEFNNSERDKQESGGWWGAISGLASSAQQYAEELEKSILDQAKAAQSQMDEEAAKIRQEQVATSDTPHLGAGLLLLPWETTDETASILCEPLMEKILNLSVAEGNFLTTPTQEEFKTVDFDMKKSVPLILKVLEIDKNLERMHAKLSPKMDEAIFWKNYFLRVKYLRAAIGIEGPDQQLCLGRLPEADVIYKVESPTLVSPVRLAKSFEDTTQEVLEEYKKDPIEETDEKDDEERKLQAAEALRKAEAAKLEAEVMAELNEEIDAEEGSPDGAGSSPVVLSSIGSGINEISIGEDEDDDAALEAMIAKELGEDMDLLDGESGCDDDILDGLDGDEDLDFS